MNLPSLILFYLDESGDLGWTLDQPYNNGGSSRYLTIAAFSIPKRYDHLPKRLMKGVYRFKRWRLGENELKSTNLKPRDKVVFANSTAALLQRCPDMKIYAITVNKEKVEDHIRRDPNVLYNYMIRLLLADDLASLQKVCIIPDPRSMKVSTGHELIDYLKSVVYFDQKAKTEIDYRYTKSSDSLNLQFIDIVSAIVRKKYEDGETDAYDILKPYLKEKT